MSHECPVCGDLITGSSCDNCGWDRWDDDRSGRGFAFDGGGVCGKQSCDRSPAYAIQDGPRRRSRCGRHALEELDGIGPSKAEALWAEFGDLEELIEDVSVGSYASSPRIAGLDGFSPDSPKRIRSALADVGLLEEEEGSQRLDNPQWKDRFVTDGGWPIDEAEASEMYRDLKRERFPNPRDGVLEDTLEGHLETALAESDDLEVRYHIRSALQHTALLRGRVGWRGTYGPENGGVVD